MNAKKPASKIIADFYESEKNGAFEEAMDTKITVRLNASSASLFSAIAARFNTTRFNLVQDVLDSAAKDMFEALTPEDRLAIAEAADKETTDLLTKNGVTHMVSAGWSGTFEGEDATWRNYLSPEQIEQIFAASPKLKEGDK